MATSSAQPKNYRILVLTTTLLLLILLLLSIDISPIETDIEGAEAVFSSWEGGTLYVDDDAPEGGDGTQENPYNRIQDAIDNATAGDTIRVYEGIFRETLEIDTTLTLIGNGSTITTIDGQGSGDVITINLPNVNISGFRIEGSAGKLAGIRVYSDGNRIFSNNLSTNYIGIYLDIVEDTHIINSLFFDNYNGIRSMDSQTSIIQGCTFGDQRSYGVGLYNSMDTIIRENSFTTGNRTASILLSDSHANLVEENHHFQNSFQFLTLLNSDDNRILRNLIQTSLGGVSLEQSEGNEISHNFIHNNSAEGIYLLESDANLILNNSCHDNEVGIFLGENSDWNEVVDNLCTNGVEGILISQTEQNKLRNNSCLSNEFGLRITMTNHLEIIGGFYSNGHRGIDIFNCSDISMSKIVVRSNSITGLNSTEVTDLSLRLSWVDAGTAIGIIANHSSSLDILNNSITNNNVGLIFQDCSAVEVHGNNIQDNAQFGIHASGNGGIVIDAVHNYWGDPSGPYHIVNNTSGTGNELTDNVAFDPWTGSIRLWALIESVYPLMVLDSEPLTLIGYGISHHSTIDRLSWSSSIDAEFYNGIANDVSISTLSNGTHTIELRVRDSNGHWSEPAVTQVLVNGKPRVSLDSLPSWALEGEDIILMGEVTEDGAIVKYRWVSSEEGLLYNGSNPEFLWKGLSRGEGILYFSVMDNKGVWSDTAAAEFNVYKQPVAKIESITPAELIHDRAVHFQGTGSASNPIVHYLWKSDILGVLYQGENPSFSLPGLPNGTHTITLSIKDDVGIWSLESSHVIHVNLRPSAIIETITPDPAVPGDTIVFVANGTDDGTIKRYTWTSDVDGELYNGTKPTFSSTHLSYGKHNITLAIQDNKGIWSLNVTRSFVLTMKPTAFIESISPNPVYPGDVILFNGRGTDDGEVVSLRWISSIDGILATTNRTETQIHDLSPGVHSISLIILDNDGAWSDPDSSILEVLDDLPPTIRLLSPSQNALVMDIVNITGTASDDKQLSRVEYQITGDEGWKAIQGNKESWVLTWDTTTVANGSYTLVFRSFDGLLYSDTVTLKLVVKNEEKQVTIGEDDDDDPDLFLLIVSFGLLFMIVIIIAQFHIKSSKRKPPKDNAKKETESKQNPSPWDPNGEAIGTIYKPHRIKKPKMNDDVPITGKNDDLSSPGKNGDQGFQGKPE